jgi:xanthine dehydrogenase accessory factor
MRDILADVDRWRADGKQIAVATIARAYGSALRPVGAKLACTSTGEISGSVSGGCVEGAVYEAAQEVLETGQPQLLEFGISDRTAWSVGLACGGIVHVWVEALQPEPYATIRDCLLQARTVARASVIAVTEGDSTDSRAAGATVGTQVLVWPDGRRDGTLGSAALDAEVADYAAERMSAQQPGRREFATGSGTLDVLVEVFAPMSRLIVVGAVHIAIPLVTFAKTLDLHTVVVDARSAFATTERFPHADELIVEWPSAALARLRPDPATCIVIVTHDDKMDIPALEFAVNSPAGYIGILGSRGHHADRVRAMVEHGVTPEQLARIHAPVGLNIGAVGPVEIALAVMAEIVAVSHGVGTGTARATATPASTV